MTDSILSETDVLIVGAGPTGLTATIELRRRGVDCRLIEKEDSSVETSRALAMQPRTLQAFEDMGVLNEVLEEGVRVTGATAYDDDEALFQLDMDNVHPPSPYPFIWFLPQNRTEHILGSRLAELGVRSNSSANSSGSVSGTTESPRRSDTERTVKSGPRKSLLIGSSGATARTVTSAKRLVWNSRA
ncbi:FAD-dependent monooxygenase [Haladaptatus pallidirubidus]|uniref:FAD-dependent monooxygenase n=1 Tax=Haladaptatus pallidirubidus TaxID=1008152 RepID=UPI0035EBA5F8